MSKQSDLLCDLLITQRDQAQEAVRQFVEIHFAAGEPSEAILALIQQFHDASHGQDDTAALWGILAAYGVLTAIIQHLQNEPDIGPTTEALQSQADADHDNRAEAGLQAENARLKGVVDKLHSWMRRDVPAELFEQLAQQCRNAGHEPCYCGCHISHIQEPIAAKEQP